MVFTAVARHLNDTIVYVGLVFVWEYSGELETIKFGLINKKQSSKNSKQGVEKNVGLRKQIHRKKVSSLCIQGKKEFGNNSPQNPIYLFIYPLSLSVCLSVCLSI